MGLTADNVMIMVMALSLAYAFVRMFQNDTPIKPKLVVYGLRGYGQFSFTVQKMILFKKCQDRGLISRFASLDEYRTSQLETLLGVK